MQENLVYLEKGEGILEICVMVLRFQKNCKAIKESSKGEKGVIFISVH